MMAESPLPALAMECRLAKAAFSFPRARAYPSAMPAADRSWSPQDISKIRGHVAEERGSSVEPGLPKITVIPKVAQNFVGNFSDRAQRRLRNSSTSNSPDANVITTLNALAARPAKDWPFGVATTKGIWYSTVAASFYCAVF